MELERYEKEHLEKMREILPECMVLLKHNGDFPLKKPGKIALYGSGARQTIKGGTGSGDVNSRFYVTVEQGLKNGGFTVTTQEWLNQYDACRELAWKKFVKDIKRQAKEQHMVAVLVGMGATMPEPEYDFSLNGDGETAIYVLSRVSGEGNDRKPVEGDVLLSKTEVRDILACQKKYRKFMLVLNVGGMVDLSPITEEVENIMVLSQLGAAMGDAFCDVVLGKSYPSGKLASTWSRWEDYAQIGTFGERDDTRYQEGIYVGYRYFDSVGKKAIFPFGFGMGYTTFTYLAGHLCLETGKAVLSVEVCNTGNFPGKETVQLYVTSPWGNLDQPYQKLIAFCKTEELLPGQKQQLTLEFLLVDLSSYDAARAAYVLEKGKYIFRAGNSSTSTEICGVLEAAEDILVRQLSHVGGKTDFEDWKPLYFWADEDLRTTEVTELTAEMFMEISWPEPAQADPEAQAFVNSLTDEQACALCIGNQSKMGGLTSIIGAASDQVAGAAGETCHNISGLPALVMADGPAGLRLHQRYSRDKKGIHRVEAAMPASFTDFLPKILGYFLGSTRAKKRIRGELQYQYCTAIPIGTAIAQSWNPQVGRVCGDVVGNEMERFGVHLWLAPAMNIHRSPLCGRNFEYYSEDPVISGVMSAAVTEGVQRHKGCGVTVKHFCCNNQEYSRYQSNSIVGERALREIYLKGFEICMRMADPCALMTSYNMLNGVHTSEREDLMRTVLRKEWGWNGVIMTDWVVDSMNDKNCVHRPTKAVPTVKAGNDLYMPGSKKNYEDVAAAVKAPGTNGRKVLSREEVNFCAAHVVQTVWRLTR